MTTTNSPSATTPFPHLRPKIPKISPAPAKKQLTAKELLDVTSAAHRTLKENYGLTKILQDEKEKMFFKHRMKERPSTRNGLVYKGAHVSPLFMYANRHAIENLHNANTTNIFNMTYGPLSLLTEDWHYGEEMKSFDLSILYEVIKIKSYSIDVAADLIDCNWSEVFVLINSNNWTTEKFEYNNESFTFLIGGIVYPTRN